MKKLVYQALSLLVAVLLAPWAVRCEVVDVAAAGRQFVELLQKEDFAGAVSHFDATMTTALPESKLRETWQALQAQAGPFQKQLGTRTSKLAGHDVVLVTCQFGQMTLDAKVVFDNHGRIAGLFFVPSHPAAKAGGTGSSVRPVSVSEKEFTVGHGDWELPGTLTTPASGAGPWPAVVLVHGSGPNDRDETLGANKPFQDLAWGLASKGIAVLRYEKRTKQYAEKFKTDGVGHLTVKEETIDDALQAAAQLRTTDGIDPKRVFVLGHSLGGVVAPRIGEADPKIAGLIILAGCLPRPLEDVMVEQTRYLVSLGGKSSAEGDAQLAKTQSAAARIKKLTGADASSSTLLMGAPPSYWLDLHQHDTLAIAKGLKQPMLILQGGRDYQVSPEGFELWKTALGARPSVTFKFYPKLNHLFIAGEGKSTPDEYEEPGHVSETVVADIAGWIKKN